VVLERAQKIVIVDLTALIVDIQMQGLYATLTPVVKMGAYVVNILTHLMLVLHVKAPIRFV
jgi:hypothetical protein